MAKRHTKRPGDLQSLFVRLEELVLANSGQDEFEEVFKLVIAKLWDERHSKPGRFRVYATEMQTSQEITHLLSEAGKEWAGILAAPYEFHLTPAHLQVCVDALAQQPLSDAGLEVMDNFFEFLVGRSAKGVKGQFFTPRYVIELCVRLLKPTAQETVLDPACGSGGFLIHTLNYIRKREDLSALSTLRNYCATGLWGFDYDARAVRVAKALMLFAGDGSANIFSLNSLLRPEMETLWPSQTQEDESVLTVEDICRSRLRNHKGFDLILTNPPFAGEIRERSLLNSYALAQGRTRIERDILFLERCLQLLRPGGRMAIVLPHNKLAQEALGYVREWVFRKARVVAVIGLGRHTFLPHTHQKAGILVLQKHDSPQSVARDYKIFFAISEKDGKDSTGQLRSAPYRGETDAIWERVDHDFDPIVSAFDTFCQEEAIFVRT